MWLFYKIKLWITNFFNNFMQQKDTNNIQDNILDDDEE